MTEDQLRAAVVAERGEQADVLTLCDGWRVREVVAHTTMPFRSSVGRTLVELAKARGDVNRMNDRCARRDAARLPAERLLASLRENVAHPWTPPGGGVHGALSHDVIHGLDITVGHWAGPPGSAGTGRDGPGRDAAEEHRILRG